MYVLSFDIRTTICKGNKTSQYSTAFKINKIKFHSTCFGNIYWSVRCNSLLLSPAYTRTFVKTALTYIPVNVCDNHISLLHT